MGKGGCVNASEGLGCEGGGGVLSELVLSEGRDDLSMQFIGGGFPIWSGRGMGGGGDRVSSGTVSGGRRKEGTGGGRADLSRQFCEGGFLIWRGVGVGGGSERFSC